MRITPTVVRGSHTSEVERRAEDHKSNRATKAEFVSDAKRKQHIEAKKRVEKAGQAAHSSNVVEQAVTKTPAKTKKSSAPAFTKRGAKKF
jgi:hypothetical protein